jgi:RNA polymerase sigma factor (TIGR02999 family)
MAETAATRITELLVAWRSGDPEALEELMPRVYQELRKLARGYLRGERSDHTLQPTALIHEAYVRLVEQQSAPSWEDRAHFYAIAARLMRQVLVDHARRSQAGKRGGDVEKVSFDEAVVYAREKAGELVALDEALQELGSFDPRKCRIVELRFFGGLSLEETAEALGVSVATVGRELRLASAWLHRFLGNGGSSSADSGEAAEPRKATEPRP